MPIDPDYLRIATDEKILSECKREISRGSGPGGQKRNKTSNAVCLVHIPTGLSVRAQETRSQNSNLKLALQRLRFALVLQFRKLIDDATYALPDCVKEAIDHGKLQISPKSTPYLAVTGAVLDILNYQEWSVSKAAGQLGISTGNLAGFLKNDDKLLAFVNARRKEKGFKPLGD